MEKEMVKVSIPCSVDVERAAEAVARDFGSSLAEVTRMFWDEMIRTKTVPLEGFGEVPNDETAEALRAGSAILDAGGTGKSFASADDLLAAALSED